MCYLLQIFIYTMKQNQKLCKIIAIQILVYVYRNKWTSTWCTWYNHGKISKYKIIVQYKIILDVQWKTDTIASRGQGYLAIKTWPWHWYWEHALFGGQHSAGARSRGVFHNCLCHKHLSTTNQGLKKFQESHLKQTSTCVSCLHNIN